MVFVAVILLLFGGPGDSGSAPVVAPPSLELLEPVGGATIQPPLRLVFRSSVALAPQAGGWGADGLHVHAVIGGTEFMPDLNAIQALGDGVYAWTIDRAPVGSVAARMRWSDLNHRPIDEGGSAEVLIEIR